MSGGDFRAMIEPCSFWVPPVAARRAVMHETVREARAEEAPVLALRLDRLESFASPVALGRQLDLGVSPTSALAAMSQSDPCLLVINKLDAVSLVSARAHARVVRRHRQFAT